MGMLSHSKVKRLVKVSTKDIKEKSFFCVMLKTSVMKCVQLM